MTDPLLRLRGICKSFGNVAVLRDVDLDVQPDVRHLLIGPNGAGKTTLFNVINGQLRPSAGTIEFAGGGLTGRTVSQRARRGLGRTFQVASLFPHLTVWENLLIGGQAPGLLRTRGTSATAAAERALEESGLAHRRRVSAGNLAYGQQRLLEIAIALASEPRMLLLDEPMAGLTQEERAALAERIVQLSARTGILLIEHDLEVAMQIAQRVTVLSLGAIVCDGEPAAVLGAPVVKQIYLG